MPEINKSHFPYVQHRQTAGKHLSWQYRHLPNQTQQQRTIRTLSRRPGLHSNNVQTHLTAQTLISVFAFLASVRNCDARSVSSTQHGTNSLASYHQNPVAWFPNNETFTITEVPGLPPETVLKQTGDNLKQQSTTVMSDLLAESMSFSALDNVQKNKTYQVTDRVIERQLFKRVLGIDIGSPSFKKQSLSPFILFMPPAISDHRVKRISELHSQQIENDKALRYFENHCHIRTKTNQGTIVGDSFLISSEYIRNPVRGMVEAAYEHNHNGEAMPDWLVRTSEGLNIATDIVFGIFTFGAYPIVKYGTAKALQASGHAINRDQNCLKHSFSPEEMTNLIFDTESGLMHRHRFLPVNPQPKPVEFNRVSPFQPDGAFITEQMGTHLNTVKYMRVKHMGSEYLIREKSPGEYYTFHPNAVKPERLEKRVYFDPVSDKIHFNSDMPQNEGLRYDIVDGDHFIRLYGEHHKLQYNWAKKTPEVVLEQGAKKLILPVYMEPLSKTWHLSVHNQRPVFRSKQKRILERMQVPEQADLTYIAEPNLNKGYYGDGKIYRAEKRGDPSHYVWGHVVEMDGKLIPVLTKVVHKHGIYYVIHNVHNPQQRSYPIEWDGQRWVFERPTSVHVSRPLKKFLSKQIYDKKMDIGDLSAPDQYGLRYDGGDKKYLKINHHYYRVYKDFYGKRFIRGHAHRIPIIYKNNKFMINKDLINKRVLKEEIKIKRILKRHQRYIKDSDLFQSLQQVNELNKVSKNAQPLVKQILEETLVHFIGKGKKRVLRHATPVKIQEQWLKKVILPLRDNIRIPAKDIIELQMNIRLLLNNLRAPAGEKLTLLTKVADAVDALSTTPLSKYASPTQIQYYGAPAYASETGIIMKGNPRYLNEVQLNLDKIRITPLGKRLLRSIDEIGIEIRPPAMSDVKRQYNGELFASNSASKKVVSFDPSNAIMGDANKEALRKAPWNERDPAIGLYHELLHVYYSHYPNSFVSKTGEVKRVGGGSALIEEARIVGTRYYGKDKSSLFDFSSDHYLSQNKAPILTENHFRIELAELTKKGYYLRPYYGDGTQQIPLKKIKQL